MRPDDPLAIRIAHPSVGSEVHRRNHRPVHALPRLATLHRRTFAFDKPLPSTPSNSTSAALAWAVLFGSE
jgi:hypothetical protein